MMFLLGVCPFFMLATMWVMFNTVVPIKRHNKVQFRFIIFVWYFMASF